MIPRSSIYSSNALSAPNRWFAESSVILFLNKTDLFKAKLITSPIYEFYSDYEGPSDYPTASAYMKSKFEPLYRNHEARPLIVHFTCATDTEQLKVVFNAVEQSIYAAALNDMVSGGTDGPRSALTFDSRSLA